MNQTSLVDQLGVMRIVDKLRFDENKLAEYMNTNEQKAKLIEKIKAGYDAERVKVEEDVIEQGVEIWYRDRLRYVESSTPWYIQLYISRAKWLKKSIATVAILLLLVAVMQLIFSLQKTMELDRSSNEIDSAVLIISTYRPGPLESGGSDIINKWLNLNGIGVKERNYPFISQSIREAVETGNQIRSLIAGIEDEIQKGRLAISSSEIPNLKNLSTKLKDYQEVTKGVAGIQQSLIAFIHSINEFNHVRSDGIIASHAPLRALESEIESLLEKPGVRIEEINKALSHLRSKVELAKNAVAIREEAQRLLNRSLEQLISDKDKALAKTLAGRIINSVNELTNPGVSDLDHLRLVERLSRTELKLVINPNDTHRNGVEREFDGSGGKSWYVIVQPLDETGAAVELKIHSVETGKEKFTNVFGLRTTKERYEDLKRDKLDNGIIENRTAGIKPIGKLDFDLSPGFDYEHILEW